MKRFKTNSYTFSGLMLILFMMGTIPVFGGNPDEPPRLVYPEPYQTVYREGMLLVKAGFVPETVMGYDRVSLSDGYTAALVSRNDSITTWVPLLGEPVKMTFHSAHNQPEKFDQLFTPLIPSNWGFFKNGRVHVICSSHQDIAWMNTPDSCRHERVHDIIIPALDLIEKEPEFKFEMEQTLNLMEVLEDAPGQRQRIIDAYKSGNFEWGATFTQPYEGLESGEQLVRQAYLGRRWIKKHLPGMDARVAYNIDVPGRSLQVPQIFSKSGIDYLFVSRMKEGFYNWHSPDGSRIFTYSPGNYGWTYYVYKYLEEDAITAMHRLYQVLMEREHYYLDHNLPPEYALVISADAGGPESYSTLINAWNRIVEQTGAAIPEIQHSTAEEFLHAVDVEGVRPDSIYGERPNLWVYIHGAAHYQAIKAKKEAAVHIPAAEIFQTILGLRRGSMEAYPQEELNEAWFKAIYPDHGWGGKNGHITDSIFRATLEAGNRTGREWLEKALEGISADIALNGRENVVVFNDLSWGKSGHARVDISGLEGTDWYMETSAGEAVPSQVIHSGDQKELLFYARDIPSVGYKTYHIVKGTQEDDQGKAYAGFYENDFYAVEFGNGGIRKLLDKQLNREIFQTTRFPGGDLFHMSYEGNGAGEFVQITEPGYLGMERAHEKKSVWKLEEYGPVFARFSSSCKMDGFTLQQSVTLYHHKKQIDFEYDIPDWKGAHNRQLRVVFPLNMQKDARVSYDVPMGIVHVGEDELDMRPGGWAWGGTYRQKPEEIHPREISNFMTISDENAGVTVSTNVVTADWIDPSRESAGFPVMNFVLLSTHKSCHGLGNWYHQTGGHHFKFSLTSHQPGWKNGFHFGVQENHPLFTVHRKGRQKGELPAQKSFVSVSDPFTVITTLKKAEDDHKVVVRLVEMERRDKSFNLKMAWPASTVAKTNLVEEDPVDTGRKGEVIPLFSGKNAIETYKLKF